MITFDYYIGAHPYVFKSKAKDSKGHSWIVAANTKDEFISELTRYGYYEEYLQSQAIKYFTFNF